MDELVINSHQRDNVLVLAIGGNLDAFSVQQVRKTLDSLIEEGSRQVVVDCTRLSYLNSTAIGVLVGRMHHLRRLDGDLVLAGMNDRVSKIVTLVGGRRLFTIYDTVSAAVGQLARPEEREAPVPGALVLN